MSLLLSPDFIQKRAFPAKFFLLMILFCLQYSVIATNCPEPAICAPEINPDHRFGGSLTTGVAGDNDHTYSMGFILVQSPLIYSVGNYVWIDEDGDSDQDAGEVGIPGVTLELRDGSGVLVETTTTDFNGGYSFEDLVAGTYSITVDDTTIRPELNNQTYDLDGILDDITSFTIIDEDILTVDFGYNFAPAVDTNSPFSSLGAIGDRIWSDANSDGKENAGEPGISGVTVNLVDAYSMVLATTTTDAAGNYIFDDLQADVYSVEVDATTLPASYVTTPTGDPDGDMTNDSERILLGPGDVYLDMDFGYNNPTANDLGDYVFVDANANGLFDAGELPIPGVTLALIDDANVNGIWDAGELPIATTITDAMGNYLFSGLMDDDYVVMVTDSDNILGNMDNTADPDGGNDEFSGMTVAGADDMLQDFGYVPQGHTTTDAMIGDFVFLDTDGDNAFTAGEPGIEDVKVELYDNANMLLATTYTDPNGMYLFGSLPAGTYKVKVVATTLPGAASAPAGLTQSVDPDGGNDNESTTTIATGGQDLDQDFGYKALTPNTISGTIWEDMDANGTLDEPTPNLFENVTVVLLDDQGNIVSTTTTDTNGDFSFIGLPDGTYTVDVTDDSQVLGDYWKSNGTLAGVNNNSQFDTYSVTVTGASTDDTADFGYYKDGASIGNLVWIDRNGDGIQDADEAPLPLVLVFLYVFFPDGSFVFMTETTDAQGHYSFNNLLLDEDYAIGNGGGTMPEFVMTVGTPVNFLNTTVDANGNGVDLADSDDHNGAYAIPVQGQTDVVQLTDPAMEPAIASYDFGYTMDCASPIVNYAITNGGISNPGQTTDFFYEDVVQNYGTFETHVPLAQQEGVIRCIDYCDFGQWSYYFNPADPDEYLFAIEHGTNITPIEYIELCVDDVKTDRYSIGADDATFVMVRDWFVRTKNNAVLQDAAGNLTTVNVRFYFPEEEFQEILNDATVQANAWATTVPTIADVYWFQRQTFDPATDIDALGSMLTPFDITSLRNAATGPTGTNTILGSAGTLENEKNHIQFNGITGFSGGTAAITIHKTPLAVALTDFKATVNDCEVLLEWEAESESDFSHYLIEYSSDGLNYQPVDQIDLVQSNENMKYSFTLNNVFGNYSYRLKMIDHNGSFNYSNDVAVEGKCGDIESTLIIYPNPIGIKHNTLNASFVSPMDGASSITIMDNVGIERMNLEVQVTEGTNTIQLDVSKLANGYYLFSIETNVGTVATHKFIKI